MENLKTSELIKSLETDVKNGLTESEAKLRLEKNGKNSLSEKKKEPMIVRFLKQFTDPLIIILLIAAVVSIVVDPTEFVDSIVIFAVVIINAIIGVVQESRAESSLDALKKMSTSNCKVIRDGTLVSLPTEELVEGDIINVEAGDVIPADARIIESFALKVDESALTGESVAVEKDEKEIKNVVALGDMKNTLFSSTYVTYGRAVAVVTKTGMNTEIGKIATMLNEEKEKETPLQHKLSQIGKVMGIMCLAICAVVFILQMIITQDWLEALRIAISLAVAAIPEGLATVVTIILSIGVTKMVKKNAIVKKLTAVETLGCTSIVCSDKTGTLTQNKMTVVEYYDGVTHDVKTDKQKSDLISYFAICCDAKVEMVDGNEVRIGDPTETALIDANKLCGKIDISKIKRVNEIPFDSERKLMTVVVKINGKYLCITKGAPDQIFKICNNETKDAVERNQYMASHALRVLALGIKEVDENTKTEDLEKDLTFVGLVGMIDPERDEVKDSIALAKQAGIKTIMITGDHVVTAEAIARKLGIFEEGDIAITSEELQKLSDEELSEKLEKISVYARVAPTDKVRIVKAWQEKGKIVSMTGDGVNDSPALKAADIGCAMGITGTDVSKEAAAMILTDDNFSTIISAVEEGRNIYANIKRVVKFLLSSNIGEVVLIFLLSLISLITNVEYGVALLPIHLLWINLITDSLPAFALGTEESGSDLMLEKPRPKDESFFANHFGFHIAIEGIIIGLLCLGVFFVGYYNWGAAVAQTMTFITLSLTELFHAFNVKTEHTLFTKETFNNKWLLGAFAIGILLQLFLVFTPFVHEIFKLEALTLGQFGIAVGFGFSIIAIMEIYKAFKLMFTVVKRRSKLK